jgi:hypothetical protein
MITACRDAATVGWKRLAWAYPGRAVIAPWLVSRVLAVPVLLAAMANPARGSRFTQMLLHWDGGFYLVIARDGYGPVTGSFPRWAFFQGFPAVIHILDVLGPDDLLAFVVNQLALLVALAGLYRLACRHANDRAAMLAVWAIALFPASFVFSMTYPSALFLATSVWGFVLVEDRHDVTAGLLAAGAAALRPNGLVVAIALGVAVRVWRRIAVVFLPALLVVAGWSWYCYERTGDALIYFTTKHHWEEITIVDLLAGGAKWSVLPHGVLALGGVAFVFLQRRKLPFAWVVFVALYLLPSLFTGMVGLARYTNECFPPFVAAGQRLDRWPRRARYAAFGASGVGLMLFAYVSGRYELVP